MSIWAHLNEKVFVLNLTISYCENHNAQETYSKHDQLKKFQFKKFSKTCSFRQTYFHAVSTSGCRWHMGILPHLTPTQRYLRLKLCMAGDQRNVWMNVLIYSKYHVINRWSTHYIRRYIIYSKDADCIKGLTVCKNASSLKYQFQVHSNLFLHIRSCKTCT